MWIAPSPVRVRGVHDRRQHRFLVREMRADPLFPGREKLPHGHAPLVRPGLRRSDQELGPH